MEVSSFPFINLRKLYLRGIPNGLNMEAVAGALLSLERVEFSEANPNEILALIRHSWKLKHIAIRNILGMEGNVIDLGHWNGEREKLAGARKVTVYVDAKTFLATKDAINNKDYRLTKIKRYDSRNWTIDFIFFFLN